MKILKFDQEGGVGAAFKSRKALYCLIPYFEGLLRNNHSLNYILPSISKWRFSEVNIIIRIFLVEFNFGLILILILVNFGSQ